jgi:hypothetical protein
MTILPILRKPSGDLLLLETIEKALKGRESGV